MYINITTSHMKKALRIISIFLLFLTGINAVVAGLLFVLEPGGQKMGMTTEYLNHTPFGTYLLPGIILFLFNGVLNLLAAVHAIRVGRHYMQWIIIQGIILCGWIVIQVIMVKDLNVLHLTMLLTGLIIIYCGLKLIAIERGSVAIFRKKTNPGLTEKHRME